MRIVSMCVLFSSLAVQAETAPLTQEELALISQLGDQTGNTDGYPQSQVYNIDQHEPAKSIIKLGDRVIPKLLALLNDPTKTKAWWRGRSSKYVLSVGDVVACILRHIGNEAELQALIRHRDWMEKVWKDACDHVDAQKEWSNAERAAYMRLFDGLRHSQVIAMWAVQALDARLHPKPKD